MNASCLQFYFNYMKLSELASGPLLFAILMQLFSACNSAVSTKRGKEIYVPKEFKGQDWSQDTSRYSYQRMHTTENLAIFWEKGFGRDLSNPPMLEEKPMAVP